MGELHLGRSFDPSVEGRPEVPAQSSFIELNPIVLPLKQTHP